MSENCFHSNTLRRDGTSQQQRTLNTLLPSYVAVDERSMKDLMQFVHSFGEEIMYYGGDNLGSGHWADFFDITKEDWQSFSFEDYLLQLKIDQVTQPHLALFFGFLYMFQLIQEDMNTITQRHLEFYYKEVLQLEEKPAETDKVSVIFELAKHVDSELLKAGTPLKGGKDNTGATVTYTLNEDTVINRAQVAEIKAQFTNIFNNWEGISNYPKTNHRIYTAPVANSADGLGEKIETEEKDWRVFGRPDFIENPDSPSGLMIADRQEGTVGFAIASPLLFLAEGQRKIDLVLTTDFESAESSPIDITDRISILVSGEEEWIQTNFLSGESAQLELVDSAWVLKIAAYLKVDQPAVVAYNNEVLAENISTQWPVLKCYINTEDPNQDSLYKDLVKVNVKNVNLAVEIDGEVENIPGIQNLIVQNDQALLDPTKPLQIFGSQPHLGSKLYIGSKEIFQKKLEYINLKFQWVDLPDDLIGFKEYYKYYNSTGSATSTSQERHNHDYFIKVEVLRKKEWKAVTTSTQLFTDASGNNIYDSQLPQDGTKSKLLTSSNELTSINRFPEIEDFEEYNSNLSKGFIRITLQGVDFGHKDFQNAYAFHAIKMAGFPNDGWVLPNPPYVPAIQELSIYYKSSISFDVSGGDEDGIEQFFHLEPFGNYEVDKSQDNTLLPHLKEEGTLFIGIEELVAPQTLAILVQLAEGSANPEKNQQEVIWSYLHDNQWAPFKKDGVLSDTTNGLLTSGIVKFDIPRKITIGNTRMNPDYYWIRAAVTKDSDAICDIIDIRTQAISASFVDDGNDPKFLEKSLEDGTLTKLLNANAAVKKLEQPYASSDGKPPEKERSFYTRVSERLRHKNRAINIWDYEHLVLEKFAKVYKVKCINHTRFDGTITNYSENAPGNVSLVIIANVQNKNAVDPLRPLASLDQLSEIASFLDEIKPPCAVLHVKNPIYEEVKVDFKVKFRKNVDVGYHLTKLKEEIKHFLSPWASDCATDIVFGGRIHKSVILNFVEERSYVDYVTCFKMFHIVKEDPNNKPNEDVDEAIALTSVSIIGSANTHEVNEIVATEDDQCQCDDNVIKSVNELTSVDNC